MSYLITIVDEDDNAVFEMAAADYEIISNAAEITIKIPLEAA